MWFKPASISDRIASIVSPSITLARPVASAFGLDNILVSPHSGVTVESMFRMGRVAAKNVADRFDGKLNPENVINKEVLGLAPPSPLLGV